MLSGGGDANAINGRKIVGSAIFRRFSDRGLLGLPGKHEAFGEIGHQVGGCLCGQPLGVAAGQAINVSDPVPCVWKPDGTIQFLSSDSGSAEG